MVGLRVLWENGDLDLGVSPETGELLGDISDLNPAVCHLGDRKEMTRFYLDLAAMKWNVRIEKSMSCIKHVVEYLARYVYRSAITNGRILDIGEKTVRFTYKNYKDQKGGEAAPEAELTLDGVEFLRRFAMHLLPKSFQRIRYFGFYAAAAGDTLQKAEKALGNSKPPFILRTVMMILAAVLGFDPDFCPKCGAHRQWVVTEIVPTNPYHRKGRVVVGRRSRKKSRPPPSTFKNGPLFPAV